MPVAQGGANCSNCIYYEANHAPFGICHEPNYALFYGTKSIPCQPDSFCSDWYTPIPGTTIC